MLSDVIKALPLLILMFLALVAAPIYLAWLFGWNQRRHTIAMFREWWAWIRGKH